jgi:hypothetical protein
MKFILSTTLTLLAAYLTGAFLPWWSISPVIAIIYLFIPLKPGIAFLSGFASLFFLWGTLAYCIDTANHHLLSKKMSTLFIQNEKYGYLILITALIGGLIGGLSALTGALAGRQRIKENK